MSQSCRHVKVAVIGSGLAGLTAAWLLSRQVKGVNGEQVEIECHLFEKEAQLGMDASSVSIPGGRDDGKDNPEWRIDVPMRSFQNGYYRELIRMYTALGVSFRKADFSYSFSQAVNSSSNISTSLIYNGASGTAGVGVPSHILDAFTTAKDLVTRLQILLGYVIGVLYLLFNYMHLLIHSSPLLRPKGDRTFRDWAQHSTPRGYFASFLALDQSWNQFTSEVLIPLFSGVCTAPLEDVLDHPAEELLEYVWLTLFTSHYRVSDGVREVVARMTADIQHIHLSSPIISLVDDPESSQEFAIECMSNGKGVTYSGFRHIVFATPATKATQILKSYPTNGRLAATGYLETLTKTLDKFSFRRTVVVNHTDFSLLPKDARDWRDLNFVFTIPKSPSFRADKISVEKDCLPESYTMTTHILPSPRNCKSFPCVLQTTNPTIMPQLASVISIARIDRAVVSAESKAALQRLSRLTCAKLSVIRSDKSELGDLQGGPLENPSIWICGSYAFKGIPLLEGCVRSARDVVELGIFRREAASFVKEPW